MPVLEIDPTWLGGWTRAFQLLRHLAVVPLSVPVMRLVQHATSDDSNPADPGMVAFDFIPGVRDALLGPDRPAGMSKAQDDLRTVR